MLKENKELQIPANIKNDSNSIEILRTWVTEDRQTFFIKPDIWEDPAAWGILLVDLAKQLANSYSEYAKMDKSDVLNRIRQGFDAEWETATTEV